MKKSFKKTLAILLSIIMLLPTMPVFASVQTASLLTSNADGPNWMKYIDGSTKLTEITIPGTHDSGAKNAGIASPWAQTQSLNITSQLNVGVRFLDMRLEYDGAVDGNIRVVHSAINLMADDGGDLTLKACIEDVYNFLNNHPSETVIMCMKEDDGNNESKIVSQINSFINSNKSKWYVSSGAPLLDQARGKIVLATRMSTLGGIYLNWGDQGSDGGYVYDSYKKLYIQDRYNMGTSNKWNTAVKPLLDLNKPNGYWSINFLSTTGANINGVSSNANIMNQLYNDYEARNNKCYGIIMFDYVSDGLCRKTYKCNDLVTSLQPDPELGEYYYRLNWNTTQQVSDGWSGVYCKLHYRPNNGTGSDKSILIFEAGDKYNGYQYVCNAQNWDFSGYVPGFPTYVEFFYDFGYGAKTLKINQRLYVGNSPSSELKLVASNDFVNSSYRGTPCKGTEGYYSNPLPKASTIEFRDKNDVYVEVPFVGSNQTKSVTFSSVVRDQYGVDWYDNSTSYSLDGSYAGVRLDRNTLYIDENANQYTTGKIINVSVKHSTTSGTIQSTTNKRVILRMNNTSYKYVNYDGTVLQQGALNNGVAEKYNSSTPTKPSDSTNHYIFKEFELSSDSTDTAKVFVAKYDAEKHVVASSIFNKATCTSAGVSNNTCTCGYKWKETIPQLDHELVTDEEQSTCAKQGYKRVHCKNCTYIESETIYELIPHDIENAYIGERVAPSDTANGYTPFICPTCKNEIVELRQYDENDWSAYNDAVKKYNDIKKTGEYNSFQAITRQIFELQIDEVIKTINSKENVVQKDIDDACAKILTTIQNFASAMGTSYYTISFIFADGTIEKTTYAVGTSADDVMLPKNSETKDNESTHTEYSWPSISDVTKNVSYYENSTERSHNYNTNACPDEIIEPSCTEGGKIIHKCECGHIEEEETSEALGHFFVFNQTVDSDGMHYDCKYCDEKDCVKNEGTKTIWDAKYANTKVIERTGADNSNITSYLDVNGDGIINAKDYAIIIRNM